MNTTNGTLSPHSSACAGRITNRMRGIALALAIGIVIVAFGAIPSPAQTTFTVDFSLTPNPAGNTFDGAVPPNPGQFWFGGSLGFPTTITLNVGDTITGTVTFSNVAGLEVADNGGGFFAIDGSFTGFERFLVTMGGTGNISETRQHSSSIEFLGVTGTLIANPITRTGGFFSLNGAVEFVQNMVNAGNSFIFTGFKYSYTLVAATTPLNINSISFRIGAESIERVCAPPAPVLTTNPVVIDVEGLAHDGGFVQVLSPYSEDGFTITSTTGGISEFTVFGCADPRFPGSTALSVGTVPATWTITNDNDELFNLLSIDISEFQTPFFGSGVLTYTGTKSDLVTTVTNDITLDGVFGPETVIFPPSFSDLVKVSVDISGIGDQFHQIDNITLEPSSPLPVISDPDVLAALADIGAETLGCGSAAPEPLPGICEIPVLVSPDVQVSDCRGFPNECEAFLAEFPQIISERPTGLEIIYFPGSSCTKIYFVFLGTEYEICEVSL